MNVGELKDKLAQFPADTPVYVEQDIDVAEVRDVIKDGDNDDCLILPL